MSDEVVEVDVSTSEEIIFDTTLAQNGQVTVKKSVREQLGLEPGHIIFLQVIKVITPKGETTYDNARKGKSDEEE